MRVFLTGGGGMVGRTLAGGLQVCGHEVLFPTRDELDLLDATAVRRAISSAAPDCVIHAAGRVGGIQANIDSPIEFLHENMTMGMNVVNGSYTSEVPTLVNLGSSCMYPRAAENPLKEGSIMSGPLEPTNEGYALAKIATSKLAQFIRAQSNLEYVTVVPCNLYGPYDKFGERAHMIPAAIQKIHRAMETGSKTVEIWGDGTARREFMYAGDLADLVISIITKPKHCPDILNAGLGWDLSINEYYSAVADVLGYDGHFDHDLTKPTGMAQKLVDISESRKLGWSAQTSLASGLEQTYSYFLETIR